MFRGSRVQIPAPYTGWTIFTFICLFERDENKRKRGRGWPIFKKLIPEQKYIPSEARNVLSEGFRDVNEKNIILTHGRGVIRRLYTLNRPK